jgi:hypothetical protein
MKYNQLISSPASPTSDESVSSGESTPVQPHYPPVTLDHVQSELALPPWVSSMRALLRERSAPALKLQEQQSSATPIASEKRHRELVEWSARVASIERELKSLMRDLATEGVGPEYILLAFQEEQDVQVVRRLSME